MGRQSPNLPAGNLETITFLRFKVQRDGGLVVAASAGFIRQD